MSFNWSKNSDGLLLPNQKKTVEISMLARAALNFEISQLEKTILGDTTSFQNVLKFESELQKLGEEYGVTIRCRVYQDLKGEYCIDISTEEELIEVAGDMSEYKLVSEACFGTTEVKDEVDLVLNPKVSQDEFHKIVHERKM